MVLLSLIECIALNLIIRIVPLLQSQILRNFMIFIKSLKVIGNFRCIAVDTFSMFYLRLQTLRLRWNFFLAKYYFHIELAMPMTMTHTNIILVIDI